MHAYCIKPTWCSQLDNNGEENNDSIRDVSPRKYCKDGSDRNFKSMSGMLCSQKQTFQRKMTKASAYYGSYPACEIGFEGRYVPNISRGTRTKE